MKCYFDGSEGLDDNNSRWLTLGGYAAVDSFWVGFNDKWQRMLHERYPKAAYIHMWQIVSGTDPFERQAGWTAEKVSDLIIDAVKLLQSFDKTRFRAFSCSMDLTGREKLVQEGYQVQEPFRLCMEMCVGAAVSWSLDKERPEPIWLYFDKGEKFHSAFKTMWLRDRTPPGQVSVDPTKLLLDTIQDIQELDMRCNPPLQAADMVAWATTRSLSEQERDWKFLAPIMRQVIPSTTARITQEMMREKSAKA